MSVLVVGSVAFDSIETPFGRAERVIGGSATYFSVAASFFTDVQLVGVIGDDFTEEHLDVFRGRPIDLAGLERVPGGKTFHWSGAYGFDLNVAETRATHLNVFADFEPRLPETFRQPDVLFLANIDPELQLGVLRQVRRPRLVALDTMNYWIASRKSDLERTIREVDLILINEAEVRQLTGDANLIRGARRIIALGPRTVVIKRGEYGVLMVTGELIFAVPAYPLEEVFDPTGAGDTFAGGFLGYLASVPDHGHPHMRRAIILGSVLASYDVEAFSLERLLQIDRSDIDRRYREFRELTEFGDLEPGAG
ncbi:MAG TPA: PfkB family carbohydrate kinase [Thermoanaerobaculia bacterium]|nr:PfkB family carbohydrate kinase [Thermoanaerobaculia bacterium]